MGAGHAALEEFIQRARLRIDLFRFDSREHRFLKLDPL